MQRYGYEVVPLRDWLGTDVVRLIELMDAELQQRADEEPVTFQEFDEEYGPLPEEWRG